MTLRKTFFWIHKWLGLFTGLIVFVVSISGCVNVFSDELKAFFYQDRYFIKASSNASFLPFTQLRKNAQAALQPGIDITRAEIFSAKNRTWIFRATATNKKAIGYWNHYQYYYRVYVNPYNGKIVYVENTKNDFFQLALQLHMNLLLGDAIGTMITGSAVLCFFILLLSGLILWFPRKFTVKGFKKGLLLKWSTGWKRLFYDLHNVLGFYAILPALLIALTGLVFAFSWADDAIQFVANGVKSVEKRVIPKSTPITGHPAATTDKVVDFLLNKHQDADMFSIRFREKDTDPLDIQVRLAKNRTHLFEWYYFDKVNAKMLLRYNDRNIIGGEKFRSMNYDLHTGAYAGIPSKILALLICLLCASMPVTGYVMWYNKFSAKTNKSKNKRH